MNQTYHNYYIQVESFLRGLRSELLQRAEDSYKIYQKTSKLDIVTEVDREVEQKIIDFIYGLAPEDGIVGEESFFIENNIKSAKRNMWYIDPIDGTINFVCKKKNFAISVAYYEEQVGKIAWIYDVCRDRLYGAIQNEGAHINGIPIPIPKDRPIEESLVAVAARTLYYLEENPTQVRKRRIYDALGFRAYGVSTLQMMGVATGELGCYISKQLSPWDYAAGLIILKEVGVLISDFHLSPPTLNEMKNSSLICATPKIYHQLFSL